MATNKKNGFTIVELMLVIAVIAVLAAVSIQMYQQYVVRTNRTAVQTTMTQIAQKLASFNMINNTYNVALSSPGIYGGAVSPLTGAVQYDLSLDTTTTVGAWVLTATPRSGSKQAGNGVVVLNSDGQRCWTKAASSCTLSATSIWDTK